MGSERRVLEAELSRLAEQRERHVQAARTDGDRDAALKHLLEAERLGEKIVGIERALAGATVGEDDVTVPISLGAEHSS